MEKLVKRVWSVFVVVMGVIWEGFWIYEAINFNPQSVIAGQYACMIVMFIIVTPIIGLFELDYLLEPFMED